MRALRPRERSNKNFQLMNGASNTIIHKKLSKRKLDDVTKDTSGWITDIKLFRGELRKLGVIRHGPDQDAPFFNTPSHLSQIQSFKSIISTSSPLILILK